MLKIWVTALICLLWIGMWPLFTAFTSSLINRVDVQDLHILVDLVT